MSDLKVMKSTTISPKKKVCVVSLMVVILSLLVFGSIAAAGTSKKLNLGMVSPSPSKMIKRFTPLMDYLNSKGVQVGKVITAKSIDKMVQLFKSGKVDFMFESVYGALRLMDEADAVPLLIREKKGVKEYNSVIFVKKNSPITSMADLKGKVIAFEDPDSTSSYMLPRKLLENQGLTLKKSRKPVPGAVAYYFSKDDDNTVTQVASGKRADAGGIKKTKVERKTEFRLLSPESIFVPRHVVIIRSEVPAGQLKSILLGMKTDPGATDVLKKIKTPTGFTEFKTDPVVQFNTQIRPALGL